MTRDAMVAPAAEGASTVGFRGHAIVYDAWTEILDPYWGDSWMETVARGAAAASAGADDVRLLLNHDANYVLARRRGMDTDTLRLSEDEVGLLCEADMDPRIDYVSNLAVSMARGDISGMSFAFEVLDDEWDIRPDGMMWMRTIRAIKLWDVSAVTYPAYDDTDAQLRALMRGKRTFVGASLAKRQGKRNSNADEAVLQSAVDRLAALVAEMQPLLESEQAEDDNDDDVAVCESVIEMANDIATDLKALLGQEEQEPDEEESSARAALAANEARRNRALGAVLGMTRASN